MISIWVAFWKYHLLENGLGSATGDTCQSWQETVSKLTGLKFRPYVKLFCSSCVVCHLLCCTTSINNNQVVLYVIILELPFANRSVWARVYLTEIATYFLHLICVFHAQGELSIFHSKNEMYNRPSKDINGDHQCFTKSHHIWILKYSLIFHSSQL